MIDPIFAWGLVIVVIGLTCAILMLEGRVADLEARLRELEELSGYREIQQ